MLKSLLVAAGLMLAAGAAHACPNYALNGATINASGSYLYQPRSYDVIAGGGANLAGCLGFSGFVQSAPDFTLYYDRNGNYDLEIRVVSNCDAVLLVNGPNGRYFYDDDSNASSYLDPRLYFSGGGSGIYDIWVGTIGTSTCSARLELESY
ncbi:hypothetical protein [Roseobacter sp. HKCCA0434]|uniref:hypothetical protein n=1 Tax=Roseobacter sp. HKCCA0434 TaxID=3079297 RepID=UPI002905A066|nr:hypothetical protein [Roseobacter sp. HKCCA0434]